MFIHHLDCYFVQSTGATVTMKCFTTFTFCLLLLTAKAITPPRGTGFPKTNGTRLLTFNETVPNTRISPRSVSLDWIASKRDGAYISSSSDGALIISNAVSGENSTFVAASQVPSDVHEYWISNDSSKVLWATNFTKQYRHSYFANYFVLDVLSGELRPLVEDQAGDIQYAEWSPTGDRIAFVRGNDLYVWALEGGEVVRITNDGGPDLFNGVPDWVYEEEILGDRFSLWWSPDGTKIAFLSFNETGVGTFTVPYYADNTVEGPPYPRELEIRYPKVGTRNPTVLVYLLDVGLGEASLTNVPIDVFNADDLIIGEVAWVTDNSSHVLIRAYNRVQDAEKVMVVDTLNGASAVVRERVESTGWLDNNMAVQHVGNLEGKNGSSTNATAATYYIDLSDESGWAHIYLFPIDGNSLPIALTSGNWEVRAILKVDKSRGLVYFTSTQRHSTESHLYVVNYRTGAKRALVDDTTPGYWSASFSAGGEYYLLSYQGPDVPYQELYSIADNTTPIRTLEDNAAFISRISEYQLPEITWLELDHPDGSKLNVLQRLPVNYDATKKYPVLFNPYGGPGAQNVNKAWKALNYNTYVSSDPELEYVQWVVDNRGTGFQGRAFRAQVAGRLGDLEAKDQVWAAQQLLAGLPAADGDHVAHWGWSYGGYLTAKVVELDSGVFTLGLITAPVTDWRFYDSMYTERYMKTPELNADGYNASAVRKMEGFKNIVGGFQITHGVGDDNVHFQNTAVLANNLMGTGVGPDKFDAVFFSDSDHGISYNGDGVFLYKTLTKRLWEEKKRVPGQTTGIHQWSRRKGPF